MQYIFCLGPNLFLFLGSVPQPNIKYYTPDYEILHIPYENIANFIQVGRSHFLKASSKSSKSASKFGKSAFSNYDSLTDAFRKVRSGESVEEVKPETTPEEPTTTEQEKSDG